MVAATVVSWTRRVLISIREILSLVVVLLEYTDGSFFIKRIEGAVSIRKPETPTTKIIEDDGLFKEELPLLMGLIRLYPWRSRIASELIAVLRNITVGRGEECDMVLDEVSVSREHADVRKTGSDALEVIDRGSSNGTFVEERRVEGSALAATGDLVRFGRCLFRVVSTAPLYQGWCQHFLKGSEVETMKHDAVVSFMQYSWPGNARELKNVLVEAVAKAMEEGSSTIARRHLRPEFQRGSEPFQRGAHLEGSARTEAVLAAMQRFKGNISHVAKDLGLHRAQIYKVLSETNHTPDDFRR